MRDLGTIAASTLEETKIKNYLFVKITVPAPTGTLRLTNYPEWTGWFGDVDGTGSETWGNARPLREGTITYGRDSVIAVTTFTAANVDYYFDDLANTHGSLREIPVELWRGHFDKDDVTDFLGAVQVYKGMIGRVRLGDEAEISLVPSRSTTQSRCPKRRFTTALFPKLPGPDIQISWGDVTVIPSPAAAYNGTRLSGPPLYDWYTGTWL